MHAQMYEELVRGLLAVVREQTVQSVLYGSTARGTAGPDSDIDIALFLNRRLTPSQQDQLSEQIAALNLKYDTVFSVIDIDQQTYLKWRHAAPFYQNVDREGIILWKAA